MTLPFELYIATRYLLARRRQAFISVISAVSALGVTVGVMALVIALALMTGMQEELRDKIVGSAAHVYVQKLLGGGFVDYEAEVAKLVEVPGVVAAAPAMLGRGMAAAAGVNAFITLKGVDPVLETDRDRPTLCGLGIPRVAAPDPPDPLFRIPIRPSRSSRVD